MRVAQLQPRRVSYSFLTDYASRSLLVGLASGQVWQHNCDK